MEEKEIVGCRRTVGSREESEMGGVKDLLRWNLAEPETRGWAAGETGPDIT